ncbi:DUF1672 domain-containing protein [Rossellomorea marisflavi]|uniref:DUF1672 domain-containing protein n=1 Tax=Rossellomorea marisflavi TaxID=189381 RepID=UPI00279E8F9A|nr:DUF1672 domain-containing protein [Rossellomorea marisflavi]UTE71814.1 DUF1672 domain-containing protein [Rossellomorea marisflavi]
MKNPIMLFACSISTSLLLGGCFGIDNAQKSSSEQDPVDRPKEKYESVLTYTGDSYDLPGGEKNEKIAIEHKDEVVKATKDYLKKEYHTDVEVHNIVGNSDGVTVFFESVGPLHFYSVAVVPIDSKKKKILSSKTFTLEGDVEKAIRSALYAYIMEDDFQSLDEQIEEIIDSTPTITGRTKESLGNAGGSGYMTPYYFVQSSTHDEAIMPVYEEYMKNPTTSQDNLKMLYDKDLFRPKDLIFSINFFMKEPDADPDKKTFDSIIQSIEENTELPSGTYMINLHDHYVIKSKFEGYKQNSLSLASYEGIIKE